MLVDTGADKSVVRADCVPKECFTGKSVVLGSYDDKRPQTHPTALLQFDIGPVKGTFEVAVARVLDQDALLGRDLGVDEILKLACQVRETYRERGVEETLPPQSVIRETRTRAQLAKERAGQAADDLATVTSGAIITPLVELQEVVCTPSKVTEECDGENSVVVSELDESGLEVTDLPVPTVEESGKQSLITEQSTDESLKPAHEKAGKGFDGYCYDDRVLMHRDVNDLGDPIQRIVVPVGRRQKLLAIGHGGLAAGHFGRKKTRARLARYFTWPGIHRDIQELCRTCPECQKAGTHPIVKAPLQPLPCVGTPFQKVAFDIVGPLARTNAGFKYLLTCMCYYTKYPEAIPLKRVDTKAVVDAMSEIFSCYGIPETILTVRDRCSCPR